MRKWMIVRVVGYLILGAGLGLGISAVRTYPAERTWVDALGLWRLEREHREHWVPVPYRRTCAIWRVGCRELPLDHGVLATTLDSLLNETSELSCWKTLSYDGRLPRDAEMYLCHSQRADTMIDFQISDSGLVMGISWTWTPADRDSTYAALLRRGEARDGPAALCPQSDDLAFTENRRWQFADRNTGITKVMDSLIAYDIDLGRIYCHTL